MAREEEQNELPLQPAEKCWGGSDSATGGAEVLPDGSRYSDDRCYKSHGDVGRVNSSTPREDLPFQKKNCGAGRASAANAGVADLQAKIDWISGWCQQFEGIFEGVCDFFLKPIKKILSDSQLLMEHLTQEYSEYPPDDHQYCTFTNDTVDLTTCGKELAWIRGARISLMQKHMEAVLSIWQIPYSKLRMVDM